MTAPLHGTTERLHHLRRDIFANLATIARLSANGVEPREYIICQSDDEERMDRAVYNLSVWKRRYAEEIARFRMRQGPKLPREVLSQTFARAA